MFCELDFLWYFSVYVVAESKRFFSKVYLPLANNYWQNFWIAYVHWTGRESIHSIWMCTVQYPWTCIHMYKHIYDCLAGCLYVCILMLLLVCFSRLFIYLFLLRFFIFVFGSFKLQKRSMNGVNGGEEEKWERNIQKILGRRVKEKKGHDLPYQVNPFNQMQIE